MGDFSSVLVRSREPRGSGALSASRSRSFSLSVGTGIQEDGLAGV